jgi:hypothetical protein
MNTQIATLRAGAAALLPIYPTSFDDVVRLARMSIIAGMIKPQKSGWGDNQETESPNATEARATMIILQGMELGIPPMQAVQLLAMINGRITAHSEAVPGLLLSKGFKIKQEFIGKEFEDTFKAVCTLTRPDGDFVVSEFSVKDAKDAGLWDDAPTVTKYNKTKPNDSAWFRYKKRMIWARALGFAAKDKGADAMKGLMVREEMEDMIRSEQARDITPVKQIGPLEIPDDIPDSSSSRTGTNATELANKLANVPEREPDNQPHTGIADVDGYISKLGDEIELCDSLEDLAKIIDDNGAMIARLPASAQKRARKMLEDAAE